MIEQDIEDKRRGPTTCNGSTAVLPLFIPREQRSIAQINNDMELVYPQNRMNFLMKQLMLKQILNLN